MILDAHTTPFLKCRDIIFTEKTFPLRILRWHISDGCEQMWHCGTASIPFTKTKKYISWKNIVYLIFNQEIRYKTKTYSLAEKKWLLSFFGQGAPAYKTGYRIAFMLNCVAFY